MGKGLPDDIISVQDASTVLKVKPRQVRYLIENGVLPAQLVAGTYLIRRGDLAKVPKERKRGRPPKSKD